MSVYSKIIKRNRRQKLGRYNRQLVIRLSLYKQNIGSTRYCLVLTRRKSSPGSRYDLLGTFTYKRLYNKEVSCLFINRFKIKQALLHGAVFHSSAYRLLFI